MDIPSTGPTSLRSNCTDDTDDSKEIILEEEEADCPESRFNLLTASDELSQAKLILSAD